MEKRKLNITKKFVEFFKTEPSDYFSSPGRIEILGNHTDHNNGLVLVGAIDLDILCACKMNFEDKINIFSEGYGYISIDLNNLKKSNKEVGKSIAIIKGIASKFKDLGYKIGGFSAYISTNVPSGSGISSSAAFECLISEILNTYYNNKMIDKLSIAKISQYAENVYFNKPCGLLDQCGVALGGINLIDFKSTKKPTIKHSNIDFDPYKIILINCGGNHSNLTEHYSSIRKEMEGVANFFNKKHLRNVPYKLFISSIKELRKSVNDRAILRAIHYYNENKLVKIAYKSLNNKKYKEFLKCINESGNSSNICLQNTHIPGSTIQNINLALTLSKQIIKNGACRIHGGGFEGTIITFIHKSEVDNYIKEMAKIFNEKNIYQVSINNIGTTKI